MSAEINTATSVLLTGDPALHSRADQALFYYLRQELALAQQFENATTIVVFVPGFAGANPLQQALKTAADLSLDEKSIVGIMLEMQDFPLLGQNLIPADGTKIRTQWLSAVPEYLSVGEIPLALNQEMTKISTVPIAPSRGNYVINRLVNFWIAQQDEIRIDWPEHIKLPQPLRLAAWTAARAITMLAQQQLGNIKPNAWRALRRTVDLELIETWGNHAPQDGQDVSDIFVIRLGIDACLTPYDGPAGLVKLNKQHQFYAQSGDCCQELYKFFCRALQQQTDKFNAPAVAQELNEWEKWLPRLTKPEISIAVELPPAVEEGIKVVDDMGLYEFYTNLVKIHRAGGQASRCLAPVLRAAQRLGLGLDDPAEFIRQEITQASIRFYNAQTKLLAASKQ